MLTIKQHSELDKSFMATLPDFVASHKKIYELLRTYLYLRYTRDCDTNYLQFFGVHKKKRICLVGLTDITPKIPKIKINKNSETYNVNGVVFPSLLGLIPRLADYCYDKFSMELSHVLHQTFQSTGDKS